MVYLELNAEIKTFLSNLWIAGCSISRTTHTAVGTGVLQSKSPEVLVKNGVFIKLTTKRALEIFKSIEWPKRRGTTAPYEELTFSYKKDITNLMLQQNIPKLILNLDQTPLALASVYKVTMASTSSQKVSTIYLGLLFFNGFRGSNFTIHIGYQVAKYKIPWVLDNKGIGMSR